MGNRESGKRKQTYYAKIPWNTVDQLFDSGQKTSGCPKAKPTFWCPKCGVGIGVECVEIGKGRPKATFCTTFWARDAVLPTEVEELAAEELRYTMFKLQVLSKNHRLQSSIVFLKSTFFHSSRLKSVVTDVSKFWFGLKMILKINRYLL